VFFEFGIQQTSNYSEASWVIEGNGLAASRNLTGANQGSLPFLYNLARNVDLTLLTVLTHLSQQKSLGMHPRLLVNANRD